MSRSPTRLVSSSWAKNDVSRVLPARREHKEHVALACELVQTYVTDRAQVVLRGEGRFEYGVTQRGGVEHAYAVSETEGDETF